MRKNEINKKVMTALGRSPELIVTEALSGI